MAALLAACSSPEKPSTAESAETTVASLVEPDDPAAIGDSSSPGGVTDASGGISRPSSDNDDAPAAPGCEKGVGPKSPAEESRFEGCFVTEETQAVSLDVAAEWWKHPPVLRDTKRVTPPRSIETILARSSSGGTKGDPAQEVAKLLFVYQVPGATVFELPFYDMLERGGLAVWVQTYPASLPATMRPIDKPDREQVTVRGRQAGHTDVRKPDGNVNLRMLEWNDTHGDGTTVTTIVAADPLKFSKDELVAWADSLVETRV